jgi:cysteinyl-tRNA synthetase
MPLQLHNTATRRKEPFAPLDAGNVRIYVCGPTVYDLAHIGNARPVIVFDVLFRLLRHLYGESHVTYVRNITDIDDKINAAAKAKGESIRDLTTRTAAAFHEDVAALGCLPPTIEPRATEHIPQIIAMIERLIASGHAYRAEGHILFSIASDADYGKFSGRSRDEMIAGARVEIAPYKKDPADFVLWKPSPPDLPGWDSPWGRGRPGWHIECSAMSEAHLGETFDIHGGGLDLIFPHHENEIAQSTCAHGGRPFARYWLHNGFVTVNGKKMAKSAGNFTTIRDVLDDMPGEIARCAMLMSHYHDPLDWGGNRVVQAKQKVEKIYLGLRNADVTGDPRVGILDSVRAALSEDLNTPLALSALEDALVEMNKASAPTEKARLKGALIASSSLLGLFQQDPETWLQGEGARGVTVRLTARATVMSRAYGRLAVSGRPQVTSTGPTDGQVTTEWIEELISERQRARKAKNFSEADRIRTELAIRGILLEDKPGGKTEWRRAG